MKEKSKTGETRRLADRIGPAVTVITAGNRFTGVVSGADTVRIAGTLDGDILCERLVWVDGGGEINGSISARQVIVEGKVKGDILAAERVELRSQGAVTGNIRAANISVAHGCRFDGEARISNREGTALLFVEKRRAAGAGKGA